jgi:uncharacterized protein YkwD
MRPLSWFGGLLIAAAVVASVGAVALARERADSAHTLTASRALTSQNDRGPDPPHVLLPAVSSSTPEAVAAGPNAVASRPPAPPPAPAVVVGSTQQALINQDRAGRGLAPLTWSGCLYNVAVANARRIAAQGSLSHTNGPQVDLSCGLGHQAGENIGYWSGGINDAQLNSMFVGSPEHYSNIVGPYRYVATAWVVASNGYGYIAVEFS